MNTRLLLLLALAIAGLPCRGSAEPTSSDDVMNSMTEDEARRQIMEFEYPLLKAKLKGDYGSADEDASSETVEKVRAYLGSLTNYNLKIAAIEMLHSRYVYLLSTKQRIEVVGPFLKDKNAYIRSAAADAVAYNRGGARYATELITLLNEPYSNVKISAMRAMSGHEQFSAQLLPYLQDANPILRAAALRSLGFKPAWETNIVAMLNDPDVAVRISAMQVLARIPGNGHERDIEQMLDDSNPNIRSHAIEGLALSARSTSSVARIAQRLDDENDFVRARAAQGLAELQATNYADSVCLLLDDKDVIPRRQAVLTLEQIGNQTHIPRLKLCASDEDNFVREKAPLAITSIEKRTNQQQGPVK